MNETHQKIEYTTDDEVIARIKSSSQFVAPKEAVLLSLLKNLEEGVPSPYVTRSQHFFTFKKIGITVLLLVVLVGGGAAVSFHQGATSPIVEPTSVAIGTPSLSPSPVAQPAPAGPASDSDTSAEGAQSTEVPRSFAMVAPVAAPVSDPSDISDQGISQDVQALDSQLQGLDSDLTAANATPD